jgi:hypothetical protein
MEKMDDALERAEWLNPDDLVEIDDDPSQRKGIRETSESRLAGERATSHGPAVGVLMNLTRLALFFMIGVGLGSLFAMGVATFLELRDDGRPPARSYVREPVIDTAGAVVPDVGKPGRAL